MRLTKKPGATRRDANSIARSTSPGQRVPLDKPKKALGSGEKWLNRATFLAFVNLSGRAGSCQHEADPPLAETQIV